MNNWLEERHYGLEGHPRSDSRAEMRVSVRRSQVDRDRHVEGCCGFVEGRERCARAAGLEAGDRCLTGRHASGKVALCQPRGFSRVADLLPHLQSQASRGEGLFVLDALVRCSSC